MERIEYQPDIELNYLIKAGIYKSKKEVVQEALMTLLQNHPQYRIEIAIQTYQNEPISLGKAAEIAGVCWEEMRKIMVNRGIPIRLGPENIEEAKKEIETLKD
ncbi:MAG: UPF0175 family protein [bacterium]